VERRPRLRGLQAGRCPGCLRGVLCEGRYCKRLVTTELVLHPDGREERIGDPPPELCASCPERLSPTPRVGHIEVVLDRRGLHNGELG
jgi:hypothetical protein